VYTLHQFALLAILSCTWVFVVGTPASAQVGPGPDTVRVFLDCNRCDEAFLKREVVFIDYVRTPDDADVHVLVTTQQTGGGGLRFDMKFLGLGRFEGVDQELTYNSSQSATADEIRIGFAQVFKLGLIRYVAGSTVANRLRITYAGKSPGGVPTLVRDPWDSWVFRINGGGNFSGEATSSSKSLNSGIRATRTTTTSRQSYSASINYRENSFLVDSNDDGVDELVRSVRRDTDANALFVQGLTEHWSVGYVGTAGSSSFRNYDFRLRLASGVEYDFFPYAESSSRMLTLQYTVGFDAHDYREETVYGKLSERLIDHRLEFALGLRQPWGSASAEVNYSQFLSDPSKYSIGAEGNLSVRLFKGFSFNIYGDVSRPRDQVYLPLGEASAEEVLLRQRQLATTYSYHMGFGVSYSFGSIFNSVVNPRFGGA
jgi:hypothetical protein